jgi:hypothetical protein
MKLRGQEMEPKSKSNTKTLCQLVAGPLSSEVQTAFGHEGQAAYVLASNARRQVWHFWLHACGAEQSQDVAGHLMHTKSRRLLDEALEGLGIHGTCPGLLNALGKLGPFAFAKDTYQSLCEILAEEGRGTKFIMHQDALTADLIVRLRILPDQLRRVEMVFGENSELDDLERISFILRRQPDLISHVDHASMGDAQKVLSILFEKVRNCRHNSRLPIAWEGNDIVQPVRSTTELKRLAASMNNCLERYWDDLHTGTMSLFLLVGEVPVAICFTTLPGLGWELHQIRGPGNRLPTRPEYQRMRQGFLSRPEFFIPTENRVRNIESNIHYFSDNTMQGDI